MKEIATMTMRDWVARLDAFLEFNEQDILTDAGSVSAKVARRLAETEYEKHRQKRLARETEQPTGDFDQIVQKLLEKQDKS